ncbi:MAG: hypothetical protein ABJA34_02495 [Pseudonocardiales bacterium]
MRLPLESIGWTDDGWLADSLRTVHPGTLGWIGWPAIPSKDHRSLKR